jgi:hypothetical protein
MTFVPAHHSAHTVALLANNTAFFVTFGIFVVALLALIVIVLTWAIRRDRAGRAAWMLRRQQAASKGPRHSRRGPQG